MRKPLICVLFYQSLSPIQILRENGIFLLFSMNFFDIHSVSIREVRPAGRYPPPS